VASDAVVGGDRDDVPAAAVQVADGVVFGATGGDLPGGATAFLQCVDAVTCEALNVDLHSVGGVHVSL